MHRTSVEEPTLAAYSASEAFAVRADATRLFALVNKRYQATTVTIRGESYHLRHRRRAGLPGPPPSPDAPGGAPPPTA